MAVVGFSSAACAEVFEEVNGPDNPDLTLLNIDAGKNAEYDYIKIEHDPKIAQNQFTVSVEGGSSLTVNGMTDIQLHATEIASGYDQGNYALRIKGDGTSANLNGDIDIYIYQKAEGGADLSKIGANGVYVSDKAEATLGNPEATVKIWTIAQKPDAVSAKIGGKVSFKSTNNQVVGSMDFMSRTGMGTKGSVIEGAFSGSSSYWFGDDQSMMNSRIIFSVLGVPATYVGKSQIEELYALDMVQSQLELEGTDITDQLNLVFEKGAQWTYFGFSDGEEQDFSVSLGRLSIPVNVKVETIPKRISSITLNDGGIINLFDEDIQKTWKEIGLTDVWPELAEVSHDYVVIGDLKGSGGIFRLDLNSDDPKKSDMVFVESSSTGGLHHIEPYNMENLLSITPENTLTFAVTAGAANQPGTEVVFSDKENIYGETLFDYELEIDSREVNGEELTVPYEDWDGTNTAGEFENRVEWFIQRVNISKSAAALGMSGAGWASHGAAVEMDRHDRRLSEMVRGSGDSTGGLWVRVNHGRDGIENQYRWDRSGATIGFDRKLSEGNRIGAWFSYTEGDTDFLNVRGSGDMKRYELAVFDTLSWGAGYLDFVGRLGRVESDYAVGNDAYSTSASFHQDYAAVSAEYGYKLQSATGVFVEPQVQLQLAYLDSVDYGAERGMKVSADSEVSSIGRIGLRLGRQFNFTNNVGELYIRGDVLHQFSDGQDVLLRDGQGHRLDDNWGDVDTWAGFGIGGAWNWADRIALQVDVEKTAGGKVEDAWLVSGRFSYLF